MTRCWCGACVNTASQREAALAEYDEAQSLVEKEIAASVRRGAHKNDTLQVQCVCKHSAPEEGGAG